jgi:hypothetical protein
MSKFIIIMLVSIYLKSDCYVVDFVLLIVQYIQSGHACPTHIQYRIPDQMK